MLNLAINTIRSMLRNFMSVIQVIDIDSLLRNRYRPCPATAFMFMRVRLER